MLTCSNSAPGARTLWCEGVVEVEEIIIQILFPVHVVIFLFSYSQSDEGKGCVGSGVGAVSSFTYSYRSGTAMRLAICINTVALPTYPRLIPTTVGDHYFS